MGVQSLREYTAGGKLGSMPEGHVTGSLWQSTTLFAPWVAVVRPSGQERQAVLSSVIPGFTP
jgi:hypothetical protein